ncbi:MAG: DUF1684 domain-containing protein [Acidobacteria bacterium]|nr:DUF1684 domain-containing protein [Acidobacteriota bacterium]
MHRHFLLICLLLILTSCNLDNAPKPVAPGQEQEAATELPPLPPNADIPTQIEYSRKQKDRILKLSPDSPIPKVEKGNFEGLKYFPVDLKYRIEAKLEKYSTNEKIKMLTSTGTQDEYIRYAAVKFIIDNTEHSLDAFKSVSTDVDPNRLFIPFRDMTSGKESYGAGRYLELEEDGKGSYTIDFNLAYSPYCAYNTDYSCPLPPTQNTLKIAINAGEKKYHN